MMRNLIRYKNYYKYITKNYLVGIFNLFIEFPIIFIIAFLLICFGAYYLAIYLNSLPLTFINNQYYWKVILVLFGLSLVINEFTSNLSKFEFTNKLYFPINWYLTWKVELLLKLLLYNSSFLIISIKFLRGMNFLSLIMLSLFYYFVVIVITALRLKSSRFLNFFLSKLIIISSIVGIFYCLVDITYFPLILESFYNTIEQYSLISQLFFVFILLLILIIIGNWILNYIILSSKSSVKKYSKVNHFGWKQIYITNILRTNSFVSSYLTTLSVISILLLAQLFFKIDTSQYILNVLSLSIIFIVLSLGDLNSIFKPLKNYLRNSKYVNRIFTLEYDFFIIQIYLLIILKIVLDEIIAPNIALFKFIVFAHLIYLYPFIFNVKENKLLVISVSFLAGLTAYILDYYLKPVSLIIPLVSLIPLLILTVLIRKHYMTNYDY